MREITEIVIKDYQVEKIICDKCGKSANKDDYFIFGLFKEIKVHGGYGSDFGDGDTWVCDLCEKCLKELLFKYMRLTESL